MRSTARSMAGTTWSSPMTSSTPVKGPKASNGGVHVGEVHLDPSTPQLTAHGGEDVRGGEVDRVLGPDLEHEGAGRGFSGVHAFAHPVANRQGVGIVELPVEAHDQHSRHRAVLGVAGNVGVGPLPVRARMGPHVGLLVR